MKKICLGFESLFQTVGLKRGLELISNALRRVTCIPYVHFLSWTSRQRKEISILLKFMSETQLSKTFPSGFELVAKGPTQLFVRDTRCHHNCCFFLRSCGTWPGLLRHDFLSPDWDVVSASSNKNCWSKDASQKISLGLHFDSVLAWKTSKKIQKFSISSFFLKEKPLQVLYVSFFPNNWKQHLLGLYYQSNTACIESINLI